MSVAAAFIWCPFGDMESARQVADAVVAERLVACANIVPGITSVFRWEGEVASEGEVGVLFKTTVSGLQSAIDRIAELHPYDTPAVAGWVAGAAPEATLEWLGNSIVSKSVR